MGFALKYGTGLTKALGEGFFGDLTMDDFEAVLAEAGRVAGEVIAPINQGGDRTGATFKDGAVVTAPGWKDAYDAWRKGGWNGLTAPTEWGGQALPHVLNAACVEMWNAASMAFAVGPLVGMSAIDAFTTHGSDTLKRLYLPKLVSGEWIATMQLTEPQAGSDVGALRTRADRAPDGSYRIKGQKIFITYGEHDLTENIIHFVLARLPDVPPGTRGISLFLVPKFLVNADGSLGARNDVRAHSIEHKLGIHGSPTCTMIFGDGDGATGFIVGEENAGMACMFTMMNRARLAVGLQGVGVAERAIQLAVAYARERRQGRTPGMPAAESAPIGAHPDVKRMLMSMRSFTQAARTICYLTALAIDRAERGSSEMERRDAHARASLLTPVAKAFSSDIGVEVASLGVQVHGGMGYIEETGAAQLFRDARIATIYEGTNGIQAIDLVTRKLPLAGGAVVETFLGELRAIVEAVNATNDPALGWCGLRLEEAVESLTRTTRWMLAHVENDTNEALAGATPYLRLFGLTTGGCLLAKQALAALRLNSDAAPRVGLARFFAENFVVQAEALERTVVEGAPGVIGADPASLQ
jgi:alkylation response protein AidB-like acyl-CoA dehydrogenase